uniref:Uncharacterized protein n=1 Tax=Oryza glumipatula TaxID=40148 RepID=A0A0E0A2B8_9ORYZ
MWWPVAVAPPLAGHDGRPTKPGSVHGLVIRNLDVTSSKDSKAFQALRSCSRAPEEARASRAVGVRWVIGCVVVRHKYTIHIRQPLLTPLTRADNAHYYPEHAFTRVIAGALGNRCCSLNGCNPPVTEELTKEP